MTLTPSAGPGNDIKTCHVHPPLAPVNPKLHAQLHNARVTSLNYVASVSHFCHVISKLQMKLENRTGFLRDKNPKPRLQKSRPVLSTLVSFVSSATVLTFLKKNILLRKRKIPY